MSDRPAVRLTEKLLRSMPLPAPGGGKEQRGRILVIGGSSHVPGAALLAGTAALRAGAGKLQVGTACDVATTLAVSMPEALVLGLAVDRQGEIARGSAALDHALEACDATLIGSGLQPSAAVATLVRRAVRHAQGTLVLDAGALSPELGAAADQPYILTPHAGEMAKLAQVEKSAVERAPETFAREFARRLRSVLVLKGATTFIAAPDGSLWVYRSHCPGLGTSGSGDVLAGIIAGLAARGADAQQAALWGVLVHGTAGRQLSRSVGSLGFLAREIAAGVPGILDRLG
jgi:ADP-dependent NAD(P)H-hydrate dehydratase